MCANCSFGFLGWHLGAPNEYNGDSYYSYADTAHYAEISTVDAGICADISGLGDQYDPDMFICAGEEGVDNAFGDGGGALVGFNSECEPVQWAIISHSARGYEFGSFGNFGSSDNLPDDTPTVYASTAFYREWIDANGFESCPTTTSEAETTTITTTEADTTVRS